jgi:hypothetical protein
MVEAAVRGQAHVERTFAGMAKGRMAQVMRQRQRFAQILVETQRARERASNLSNFKRMSEPGPEVVALMKDENLGLMGQPAERSRMDNAIAVATEVAPGCARDLGKKAPAGFPRIGGKSSTRGRRVDRHDVSRFGRFPSELT